MFRTELFRLRKMTTDKKKRKHNFTNSLFFSESIPANKNKQK